MDLRCVSEWVCRAKTGDADAFTELVKTFQPVVFGIAFAVTRDPVAAEDVSQDAFIACWSHLDSLRKPEGFPCWLRQTTRNLARNWIRSTVYRRQLKERWTLLAETLSSEARQDGAQAQTEVSQRVMDALHSLPSGHREAMVLYYLQGRSSSEAAAALGVSEAAMRQRLKRGKDQLRAYFEERWEREFDEELRHLVPDRVAKRFPAILALGAASPRLARLATRTGLSASVHTLLHERALILDWLPGARPLGAQRRTLVTLALPVALLLGALYAGWTAWPRPEPGHVPKAVAAAAAKPVLVSPPPPPQPASPSGQPIAQPPPPDPVELVAEAQEGHTLYGNVHDLAGKPIPGATVTAYTGRYAPDDILCHVCLTWVAEQGPTYSAVTDAEGAYIMDGIQCDHDLLVTAAASGYATGLAEHVPLDAADADFALSDTMVFSGVVIDAGTGAPIPKFEAKITCVYTSPAEPHMCSGTDYSFRLFEGTDGAFSLNTDHYSVVAVGVHAIGYADYESSALTVPPVGMDEPRVIELQPGRTVGGTVVDSLDNPVPLAFVMKVSEKATQRYARENAGHTAAVSDANGRFELTGVADDSPLNFIGAWHPDFAPAFVPNPGPQEEAIIRLQKPGAIRGVVRNGRQPSGALYVRARLPVDHPYRLYSTGKSTSEDGQFLIDGLPPGVNTLEVIDRIAERFLACEPVVVEPGIETVVEIDLSAMATVSGSVAGLEAYDDPHLSVRRDGLVNFFYHEPLPPTGEFYVNIAQSGTCEIVVYEHETPLSPILTQPIAIAPGEDIVLELSIPPDSPIEDASSTE